MNQVIQRLNSKITNIFKIKVPSNEGVLNHGDDNDAHVHDFHIEESPMSREVPMDLDDGQGQAGVAQGAAPPQGGAQAAGVDLGDKVHSNKV